MSTHAPGSARALALQVLRDIERRRGFSNRVLSEHLERAGDIDPRDRALVTTLVYGTLRARSRLDFLVDAVASKPRGLRGEVRELLRLGVFELCVLEHPLRVAASEAVRLARRLDPRGGLGRTVHGILAAVERRRPELERELDRASPLEQLEHRYSIPAWLAERWLAELGPARAIERAVALAAAPALDVRIDLGRTGGDAIAAELARDHPGAAIERIPGQLQALRVRGAGDLFHGPLHDRGLISVQGLGAQQAAIALAPRPGERILDACCGMGTKTLQIAELMERRGTLVAADDDPGRLRAFTELRSRGDLDREGLDLRVLCVDLTAEATELEALEPFDGVLLDAPCTGLGNLARHPELRYRTMPADLVAASDRQRALLDRALRRVAPGGRVVYSVCSLEPEEGAALVRAAATGEWVVAHEATWTPEQHACDGFYLAILRRDPAKPC